MLPSSRQLTVKPAFPIGGEVALRMRPEWLPGLVTALVVRPGSIGYVVSWGDGSESTHHDFELREAEPEDTDP